jgi:ligand-binding sensor domain-containing protein
MCLELKMYNSMTSSRLIFLSKSILFFSIILSYTDLSAQDGPVGIGDWQSHLSYETTVGITESDDAVFYASAQAVLKVYKEDRSLEHLNKVSGLSDMRIKTLEYNRAEKILVIAYTNGNIDLLYDNGQVTNLSAIFVNANIVGDKSINHIYNVGKKIYFSCAFGLVVYDLDLDAFSQTTFTASEVNACAQLNDTLFIATNEGIYTGVLDGRNLLDFGVWELQGSVHGLNIGPYSSKNLIVFQDKIYADAQDTLFQYDNGQWGHIVGNNITNAGVLPITYWLPTSNSSSFVTNYDLSLSYAEDLLIIATNTSTYYTIAANDDIQTRYYTGAWRLQDILIDQNNKHWAADLGYIHYDFKYIEPNAPLRNLVSDMHVDDEGTLWVASSPYNTYKAFFNASGFFRYKDGIWKMYNKTERSEMNSFWDAIRIISNPKNNKIYVGSFLSGILELDQQDSIVVYDQYTTPELNGADGDPSRTRIMGLAVDEDDNVWMTNSKAYSSLLVVKKLNGDWKSFPASKFNDIQVEDLVIDRNGYKWIKQVTGKITVFDSGDLDDDTDDRSIHLGDNNTALPNNGITCMKSDKKGVIWVGSNAGITIFNCSSNIFDGSCQGNRPIISQDNFNGYLLEGEEVLTIEVDGANRKWVGTKNGLFLLSADGYEQLAYFTAENSPLFDNEVTKLAIDGITGTLYIATLSGIQSYRSDATTGLRKMPKENITVFPHPIEPDYTGPIAISNLADEANVKITDISGRLVYETTALGGQAIWNGTDYNGRRAQSGVYLVFIVNDLGSQQAVCKILFMN